jgi:cytochrome c-type biogenesis protein CcmH
MRLPAVLIGVFLVLAGPAHAADAPTLADLEDEVVCPTCETTLEMSNSPVAERMRAFIRERIAAGDSKAEIKAQLVDQFGEAVLAAPPKRGFNLLAWLLPFAGLVAAGVAVTLLARRWLRARAETAPRPADPSANGRVRLDPELERRVDEELARFDS